MEIDDVKSDILKNEMKSVYIFTGEEIAVMSVYIKMIIQSSGATRVNDDTVASAIHKSQSNALFGGSSVYVVWDDMDFFKNEKVWDIDDLMGNNRLVLVYTKIDGRSKFYNHFKSRIVKFEYMKEDVLVKYAKKAVDMNEGNIRTLIDLCEHDYGRILLEADKINTFAKVHNVKEDKAFKYLVKNKIICIPPKDAIFDLVNAILGCSDNNVVYDLLEDCKAIGESPLVIASVLYNTTKQVYQVQSVHNWKTKYRGDKKICELTGLTPWQVRCAMDKADNISNAGLMAIMQTCADVEQKIKSGKLDISTASDYLISEVLLFG